MINNISDSHIFKASPFAGLIVLTDSPQFTIVGVTDNFLSAYHKKESDVLQKDLFEIFDTAGMEEPNEKLQDLFALLSTTIENKINGKLERFYVKDQKDTKYPFEAKYVDLEVIPVLNESDLASSIIISFQESKNSQYYSRIVENTLNAFFLIKADGTILEANKAACDLFGYSLEELRQIGREGIIDHTETHIQGKIKESSEKGILKVELIGIKKNGEKFPIEVCSLIYSDVDGEKRTSTAINDITDRKNTENALLRSEFYLNEAQKLAKIGSWNFDFKADKLTWTDGLYGVFGANKETFLETHGSFVNLVTDEDRAFVEETSQQAQLTGDPFNIEYRITTPAGENRIIEEFGYSERNSGGDIVRLFGTAQDITERKQVQQELILSEKKYKALFEDNPLPMIIWDFQTLNIIDCNEEALIKYGYTREEFLQLSIRDIRLKDDITLINNATENENKYGLIHKEEWRHVKKNGELMQMEITGHLLNYNGRRVSLVLLNDVTERHEYENSLKQLNEKLEQQTQQLAVSNKDLEQFAYVASHDLQEPLRMVTSFLTLLENKYENALDDKGKQYIHFAVDGAKRMRQIILDLLEFSRVGRIGNEVEQLNVNELLSDVVSLYTTLIEESNATIEIEKLPGIKSHKAPLSQVFQNLIGNALKYRHKEREPVIKIGCTKIPAYWMFSVRDNGIGIEERNFEKIFIIFQRLHSKDQYTGSGIGLAIVKKIINNLGGKIWVESEEGKGTAFYFTLPH